MFVQALEQLAVASRALPALRPRFLNLDVCGLSKSELSDNVSESMCLGSNSAVINDAELDNAFELRHDFISVLEECGR